MTPLHAPHSTPLDVSTGAHPQPSVLLFAAQPGATDVARALSQAVTHEVTTVNSQVHCLEALHHEAFDLVLFEESVLSLNQSNAEALYDAAGTAVVVEVNFGLMQPGRIVLAVHAAMHRRRLDLARVRAIAGTALQDQLTTAAAGLLLEAQLAQHQAAFGRQPDLERLVALAEHLCSQLRANDVRPL